ncbi:hypothetical protein H4I96_03919 [Botrytis cinerea]
MVQGALKSTKSALAGGNRANGAGKKAALGPKKGQRVIKAKKDGLRRSEVLRKWSPRKSRDFFDEFKYLSDFYTNDRC